MSNMSGAICHEQHLMSNMSGATCHEQHVMCNSEKHRPEKYRSGHEMLMIRIPVYRKLYCSVLCVSYCAIWN